MKFKLIKISEIVESDKTYPRERYSWQTAYDYSESMRSGAKFPPIAVALYRNRYYLVDGKHRIEGKKIVQEEYIKAEILKNLTQNEIYIEAVKRNIGHGRQFSPYEKRKIVLRMKDMKLSLGVISKLIGISMDKVEPFTFSRMSKSMTTGEDIIVKTPLKNLAGLTLTQDMELAQEQISVQSQLALLNQITIMISENLIDYNDEKIVEKMKELKKLVKGVKL